MATFTTNTEPDLDNERVLASWKGIAAYFGCNVRTAKRWEQGRGLPVRRAPGKKGSTVFAYASELDAWLRGVGQEVKAGSALFVKEFSGDEADAHLLEPPSFDAPQAQSPAAANVREALEERISGRRFPFLIPRIWVFACAAIILALLWVLWNYGGGTDSARTRSSDGARLNVALHVPSPGAEELYERGRYFWNLRTHDSLSEAIDAYTQAILKDPSYAEAYAGLAESYDLLPQFAHADLGDSLTKAESAADRAIVLNPNLAAAHRAKAFALYYWDWDIAGSDAEFKRALALDPNSAETHQWYAGTLECRSEGAKAIVQIDEALRLDPTSPAIATDAALLHADFGDFNSGVKALKEIEQTQPTLSSPAEFLSDLYFATGDFPAYIEEARRFASITHAPDAIALANAVAQGWARAGRTGLLEARAEALKAAFDKGTGSGFLLGENLLLLGRRQEALEYFKASLDRHDDRLLQLMAFDDYPWVREISSDPGYAALFAKIRRRVREVTPAQPEQARVSEELPQ